MCTSYPLPLPNNSVTESGKVQPGQPYSAAAAGTFGRLTSTVGRTVGLGTPRQIQLAVRFNYGETTPWVTSIEDGLGIRAIAGPDKVLLRAPVEMRGEGMKTVADFEVAEGDRVAFVLSHHASHLPDDPPCDFEDAYARTVSFWEDWGSKPLAMGRVDSQPTTGFFGVASW